MTPAASTATDLHITLAEASRLFPRKNGKSTPVLTIKRWIIKGCRGVRLQGAKVGNCWFTSADAVAQFRIDCTARALPRAENTQLLVRADAAAAMDVLRRRGVFSNDNGGRNGREAKQGQAGSTVHGLCQKG